MLVFFVGKSFSQTWEWARGSINPSRVIESWPITVDPAGNIYESGMVFNHSGSVTSTTNWGSYSVSSPTNYHVVVVSSDSSGAYRWIIRTNGAAAFMINLVSDACGYIYLYGFYNRGTLTFGSSTVSNPFVFGEMYFLAKIDANGNVIWVKNVGRQSSVLAYAYSGGLSINKMDGEIYVSGLFNGSSTTIGATALVNSSSDTNLSDVFVAKYNTSGVPIWSRSFGGDSTEDVFDMAAATNGDVYLGGFYYSPTVIVGADTLSNSLGYIKPHVYIAKFDRLGNPIWARSSVGNYLDRINAMATDNWNNIYMVGAYKDTFAFGSVSLPYISLPHTESYLLKFDSSGTALWARTIAATSGYPLNGYGVATDNNGNVWMSSGNNMGSASLPEPMYIVEYDTAGTFIDSASKNSGGDDENAIAIDNRGNLYIGGDYVYTPFIVGSDTLSLIGGSGESVFIAKYRYPFVSSPIDTLAPVTICRGTNSLLLGGFQCGKWISDNPAIAAVDSVTGLLTGISPGTTTITYHGGSIGYETVGVTVIPGPSNIIGPGNMCESDVAVLIDSVAGGIWSSSSGILTISASGSVTTGTSGVAIVTYTIPNGCFVADTIRVFSSIPPITGTYHFCSGISTPFFDSVSGGVWGSSDWSVATISSTGIVSAVSVGTSLISYTLGGVCWDTLEITVNPNPSAIVGADSLCIGDTILLTDTLPGGSWISGDTAVAVFALSGNLIGLSFGTAVVTYISPEGCEVSDTVKVINCPSLVVTSPHSKFLIYPIPTLHNINIKSDNTINSIDIFNTVGQLIFSNTFHSNNIEIPFDESPPGIYIMQINKSNIIRLTKY